MSDIFDEKEDLKNLKSFVSFLRNEYEIDLHERHKVSVTDRGVEDRLHLDVDELRMRNHLATQWPGDEIVSQIIKDTCIIMKNNNLKPGDLV